MKKGFTLIELLAVIVILAIIALIATPIILGIINDARKESNERSVELYASAVRNAIASYQLTHPNAPTKFSDLNIQYDGNVVCAKEELYADGNFYIADCTVNGDAVDYTYGTYQIMYYKPDYYSWSGEIDRELPSGAKKTVSELNLSYPFYIGLDVDENNIITATYGCFTKKETEYCLKSTKDGSAHQTNIDIIKEAFKDVVDTDACSLAEDNYICNTGDFVARTRTNGSVDVGSVGNINVACTVSSAAQCVSF